MIRRSFDSNGDYAINSFVEDSPATIQAVATRLRLFRGEFFLNLNDGVPYFQEILVKPANISRIETIIRNTISQTDGVKSIDTFEILFDSATRKLTISFTATTIYGDIFSDEDIDGINPLGV